MSKGEDLILAVTRFLVSRIRSFKMKMLTGGFGNLWKASEFSSKLLDPRMFSYTTPTSQQRLP